MKKLEQRIAFYEDGSQEFGKTTRKSFSTEGLLGIVAHYSDGTREVENIDLPKRQVKEETKEARIARLRFEKQSEFKWDGGDTPEIRALGKDKSPWPNQ